MLKLSGNTKKWAEKYFKIYIICKAIVKIYEFS